MTHDILHPIDFPPYVSFSNKYFSFKIQSTYSGCLNDAFVENAAINVLSLETCILSLVLTEDSMLFFITLGYAMAFRRLGENIYYFDSHSRDENGFCVENGDFTYSI